MSPTSNDSAIESLWLYKENYALKLLGFFAVVQGFIIYSNVYCRNTSMAEHNKSVFSGPKTTNSMLQEIAQNYFHEQLLHL